MIRRSKEEKQKDQERESELFDFAGLDPSEAIEIFPKKRQSRLVSIRLSKDIIHQLKRMAEARGDMGYQTLIKEILGKYLEFKEKISIEQILTTRSLLNNAYRDETPMNKGSWINKDTEIIVPVFQAST